VTISTPRHIVLIGMMGVGKSTIGEKLATELGYPFVDLDVEIASRAGKTIPEIFSSDGESGFRRQEAEALLRVLDLRDPLIVATGGGIVEGASASALPFATCVWLTATVETLSKRVGGGEGRPLLVGNVEEILGELLERRSSKYAEAATFTVSVDGKSVPEVLGEVMSKLEASC